MDIEVEKSEKNVAENSTAAGEQENLLARNSSSIAELRRRNQVLKAQKKISYNSNQNGYRGTIARLETYLNASKSALAAQKPSSLKTSHEPESSIPCGKIIKLPAKSDSK